ncbi:MAG TPA: AMP-binding protein, partial [Dehalococcoidia bacterium]|nr:AMP-binding protein [Dehalococcoidia bacterium]
MFTLQNAPLGELELPGLSLSPLELESAAAKFDLTLVLSETEQGLMGEWEYSTELFERSTIARLGAHLETLLRGIVADPTKPVGELVLLSEAEREQVLVGWNGKRTEALLGHYHCLHQKIEAQVEKTPEAIAVAFEEEQLTYRELNQRVNQLAHHLQKLGVEPEVLVGVCVERSLELVVGLLGILKAGGAYVPLDPSYPPERLAFMVEDAQVPVLLTQAHLVATLPKGGAQVVCLDREWGHIAMQSPVNPVSGVRPENLAYVIYTSGSTGKPKGTLITHRGLTNYMDWCLAAYPLQQGRGSLVHSTIAFDATVTALFSPLLVGGTVSLLADGIDLEDLTTAL